MQTSSQRADVYCRATLRQQDQTCAEGDISEGCNICKSPSLFNKCNVITSAVESLRVTHSHMPRTECFYV